jgi:hypothetical protein
MDGRKGAEEKGRPGEGYLGHIPEEAARKMVSGELEKQARSLTAPKDGSKVVLEERALVELEVVPETQMSTGTQSISRLQGEVGGATGVLGSSLDEVYIDEEAFGALVGEMREMVEGINVPQTETAEWGSISPLPATPKMKRDASTDKQTLQESGLFVDSGETRRKKKKKKISSELGEGQSGLGGEGRGGSVRAIGDSTTEVAPQSLQVSSLPLILMDVDVVASERCVTDGDGVSQASSGTPGPPIPNPLPASWGSQRGDAVDGEASEERGHETSSMDVRGVREMVSSTGVSPMSSRVPSLRLRLVLPDGGGVSQAISGTPGPPIPNPLSASWGSQGGGMGGGKVGGASEAAGPATNFDEDLYPE